MDKPISLSVKNFLIRKMAVDMMIPEKVLEIVINHQFGSALDALSKNRTVELSGFGKFVLTQKRIDRAILKYSQQVDAFNLALSKEDITEQEKKRVLAMMNTVEKNINALNARIHEH